MLSTTPASRLQEARVLDKIFVDTLTMIMRSQKNRLEYTIVPTLYDKRTQASVKSLNELRRTYPEELWRFMIPVDTRFRDASQAGVVPSRLDADTQGVRAYRRLLQDLQEGTTSWQHN